MTPARRSRRWVALLRGINVGRAKRIAMADLRALVAGLGFGDVRTLLNSGNVVFDGAASVPARIADRIEAALAERLGVRSRVTVLAGEAIPAVIEENPLRDVADDPSRLLVAFPRDPALASRLAPLAERRWGTDAFALGSHAAYLWCAGGILESELLGAVSKALGDEVTTRNLATVTKLRALVEAGA